MKRFIVIALLIALCAPAMAANLLQNGDFSNGTANWTFWVQRGSNTLFTTENGQAKFWGANFNGGIYQTFTTVPGVTYVISGWGKFAINNTTNQDTWSEILIGNSAPVNGSDYGSSAILCAKQLTNKTDTLRFEKNFADWTSSAKPVAVMTFTATATQTTLVIKHGNSTGSTLTGLYADNVVVQAVPEPSSLLALASGLAGLGGFVIRRRK